MSTIIPAQVGVTRPVQLPPPFMFSERLRSGTIGQNTIEFRGNGLIDGQDARARRGIVVGNRAAVTAERGHNDIKTVEVSVPACTPCPDHQGLGRIAHLQRALGDFHGECCTTLHDVEQAGPVFAQLPGNHHGNHHGTALHVDGSTSRAEVERVAFERDARPPRRSRRRA